MPSSRANGFGGIPNYIYLNGGLDANLWAMINALAVYADRNGYCFPSQGRLATELGRSRAWVIQAINQLVDLGLVTKTHRTREFDKGNTSCGYLIHCLADVHQNQELEEDESSEMPVTQVTPPVKKTDTNNQQTKNNFLSQESSEFSILTWQPQEQTFEIASQYASKPYLDKHLKRFKRKVSAKGYEYKSMDDAWLLWLQEDITKPKALQTHYTRKTTSSPISMMQRIIGDSSSNSLNHLIGAGIEQ